MTTLQKTSRPNFIRYRRNAKNRPVQTKQGTEQRSRRVYHSTAVYLPIEPKPVARRVSSRSKKQTTRQGYDFAFSLGNTKVHAPALNLPQMGPRWISAILTLFLGIALYTLWTARPFMVMTAEVTGAQRLGASEINAVLALNSQPIFKVIPSQIETILLTAYSDLESVKVHVLLPNRISVEVRERTPVLAWYQNGAVTWIDADGMAFTPRGDVAGLVQVSSSGTPTLPFSDSTLPVGDQKFMSPEMVQALIALAPDVPTGMPMIFDPVYGMGWQDPLGWTTYFGQNAKDIPMKKIVYNAILESLTLQGVQPSLISVEYLNAPFYK